MKEGINSLWKNEDYWAIWFGFAIMIGALLQWIPKIPRVGSWSDNPLDAFAVISDGAASGTTLLPLLFLMVGLTALTVIGVAFMKTDRIWKYLAGFAGVFVLSCIAYWVAHQTNVKYWGLSYALWALRVALLISNTVGTPGWL